MVWCIIDWAGQVGPCVARLDTMGDILELVVGAFGEASTDLERVIVAMAESRVLYLSRETCDRRLAQRGGWPVPPPLLSAVCQGTGSLLAVPAWSPWPEGKGGSGQEEGADGARGEDKDGSCGAPCSICERKEEEMDLDCQA